GAERNCPRLAFSDTAVRSSQADWSAQRGHLGCCSGSQAIVTHVWSTRQRSDERRAWTTALRACRLCPRLLYPREQHTRNLQNNCLLRSGSRSEPGLERHSFGHPVARLGRERDLVSKGPGRSLLGAPRRCILIFAAPPLPFAAG